MMILLEIFVLFNHFVSKFEPGVKSLQHWVLVSTETVQGWRLVAFYWIWIQYEICLTNPFSLIWTQLSTFDTKVKNNSNISWRFVLFLGGECRHSFEWQPINCSKPACAACKWNEPQKLRHVDWICVWHIKITCEACLVSHTVFFISYLIQILQNY